MSMIDPVRLEVLRHALVAIAEEMSLAVWRTSRSTVVRELLDYSTAIFDPDGYNVAQSARLPNHLNSMGPCLQNLMRDHIPVEQWEEGDVILTNDPYCGAQHLPDLVVFRPVFFKGQRIAITGAMAHHVDVGGGAAGSYNAHATDIFQEGIRIPPLHLFKREVANTQVLDLILRNVREPEMVRGDLMSQIASLSIGERGILGLANKYGSRFMTDAATQIISQSERLMRAAISTVPDGHYCFEDFLDDDGITTDPLRVAVALTVSGDRITVDLTGSSPQAAGPINCTLNMTKSGVYYALIATLAGDVPANAGCYAPIEVIVPEGTLVNCRFPAPVVGRIAVCHRVVNVIMGALARALPDRVPASYYGVSYVYAVEALHENGSRQVYLDAEIGGYGADSESDGANALSAGIHNIPNTPIEMIEAMYPITFTQYGLRPNSGGPGRHRGGLGVVREWRLDAPLGFLSAAFDRFKFAPCGLFEGKAAAPGRLSLRRGDTVTELGSKIAGVRLKHGDIVRVETSGGGGYGDPLKRDRAAIAADLGNGFVTPDRAIEDYGFDSGDEPTVPQAQTS